MPVPMLTIPVVFLLSLPSLAQAPKKTDLQLMQGHWEMVALEINGKLEPDNRINDTVLEIFRDKYIVKSKKNRPIETTFTVDPTKKPKTIDMTFTEGDKKNKVLKGIYFLEGDTLKVCRGLQAEQDRPTEFATWPDTNVFVVTWKRLPPKEKN
jgi:uncharacterized protein (TIGR03067 family)